MSVLRELFNLSAISGGLWQAFFQLITLGIAAAYGTFVFQRSRARDAARQQLINEIGEFSIDLYRPRKLYQIYQRDPGPRVCNCLPEQSRSEVRGQLLQRAFEEFVGVVGRFRALQIKLVPLFGYNQELFAYYLAIWWYLKEVRMRMQDGEHLFFHHDDSQTVDAFYRLIDAFRYRIAVAPFVKEVPDLHRPPREILEKMYAESEIVYHQYFGQNPVRRDTVMPPQTSPDAEASRKPQVP
jgi:hypothetical protein